MNISNSVLLLSISIFFSISFLIRALLFDTNDNVLTSIIISFIFIGVTMILLMLYFIEQRLINIFNLTPNKTKDNYDKSRKALTQYYANVREIRNQIDNKFSYGQCLYETLVMMRPDLAVAVKDTPNDPNNKSEFDELQPFYTWLDTQWSK